MKFLVALSFVFALPTVTAFAPSAAFSRKKSSAIFIGSDPNVELGGNSWKPDSEKMGVSFECSFTKKIDYIC